MVSVLLALILLHPPLFSFPCHLLNFNLPLPLCNTFSLFILLLSYSFSFYLTFIPLLLSLTPSIFPTPHPSFPSLSRLWVILNNCSTALSFGLFLSRFGCYLHTQHALTTPKTICKHTWRHVQPPTQSSVKVKGVCLAQQDQSHTESHLRCTNQWPCRCMWASLFTSLVAPLSLSH